jgi:hypothetical protein
MAKTRLPWKLRASDFAKPGWHTRPTVGYELMFAFLRVSPSYELARKENEEGLTEEETRALPADFDEVRKTYALLGDVQQMLFRSWWLKRGLKAFGNPHTKPRVHEIATLENSADKSVEHLRQPLEDYLGETRRDEGLSAALLVSIPLGRRKGEILAQISRLLDRHSQVGAATANAPTLSLKGQRLRAKSLFAGLRLLWFRSAKPKWELWRLGAQARLSKTYSSVLDPTAGRRVKDVIEQTDRDMMTKITHRALNKFETIAENAARGRFPSDEPVEKAPFDYPLIAKRIQRNNAWEKKEKERLTRLFELRQAKRAQKPSESDL